MKPTPSVVALMFSVACAAAAAAAQHTHDPAGGLHAQNGMDVGASPLKGFG